MIICPFEVGEFAMCIDNRGCGPNLEIGRLYEVVEIAVDREEMKVMDERDGEVCQWSWHRFVKAQTDGIDWFKHGYAFAANNAADVLSAMGQPENGRMVREALLKHPSLTESDRDDADEPFTVEAQYMLALQQICLLADTGSDWHKQTFDPEGVGVMPSGWRVAEKMREIARDVLGKDGR